MKMRRWASKKMRQYIGAISVGTGFAVRYLRRKSARFAIGRVAGNSTMDNIIATDITRMRLNA